MYAAHMSIFCYVESKSIDVSKEESSLDGSSLRKSNETRGIYVFPDCEIGTKLPLNTCLPYGAIIERDEMFHACVNGLRNHFTYL